MSHSQSSDLDSSMASIAITSYHNLQVLLSSASLYLSFRESDQAGVLQL